MAQEKGSGESVAGIERQIAEDMMEYVRSHPEVCADGRSHGYSNLRWHGGEWQVVKIGGFKHRRAHYLTGVVYDDETALDWFIRQPVRIVPQAEMATWINGGEDLWGKVEDHDVFSDGNRCFWCGNSGRNVELTTHLTVAQGDCDFCSDCFDVWDKQNEIDHSKEQPA